MSVTRPELSITYSRDSIDRCADEMVVPTAKRSRSFVIKKKELAQILRQLFMTAHQWLALSAHTSVVPAEEAHCVEGQFLVPDIHDNIERGSVASAFERVYLFDRC